MPPCRCSACKVGANSSCQVPHACHPSRRHQASRSNPSVRHPGTDAAYPLQGLVCRLGMLRMGCCASAIGGCSAHIWSVRIIASRRHTTPGDASKWVEAFRTRWRWQMFIRRSRGKFSQFSSLALVSSSPFYRSADASNTLQIARLS